MNYAIRYLRNPSTWVSLRFETLEEAEDACIDINFGVMRKAHIVKRSSVSELWEAI